MKTDWNAKAKSAFKLVARAAIAELRLQAITVLSVVALAAIIIPLWMLLSFYLPIGR